MNDGAVVLFESHFKGNYIHVRDVCRTFLHGIDNFESMKSQIYMSAYQVNVSKLELCKKISEQVLGFVFVEHNHAKDPDQNTWFQMQSKQQAGIRIYPENGISELIKGFRMIRNRRYGNV